MEPDTPRNVHENQCHILDQVSLIFSIGAKGELSQMSDEETPKENLADYPQTVRYLEKWTGTGHLRWRHETWQGPFALLQLLNGRLRVVVEADHSFIPYYQRGISSLALVGETDKGTQISAEGIHFNRLTGPPERDIYVGYARNATLRFTKTIKRNMVFCGLSNYSLHQRRSPVTVSLADFDLNIESRSRNSSSGGIEEHSIAYRHAGVSTYLAIRGISRDRVSDALNCLRDVANLLSIAFRGFVFVVAEETHDFHSGEVTIKLQEPPFSARGWGRPLVPSESIDEFLVQTYPGYSAREERLELSHIVDHYLQALTLRSIWPQSVGIFTAMETLKAAFFRRFSDEANEQYQYWIVPKEDFSNNRAMIKEVIAVLASHFERFANMDKEEKSDLWGQIMGLHRRPYRTQLTRMLDELGVDYDEAELTPFIRTRNKLIHEGTPVPVDTPLDEYEQKSTEAWKKVRDGISLFERALLASLNYSGPCELYKDGFSE